MAKKHFNPSQGTLQRGTAVKPAPYHAGSGAPKGRVHDGVQPRVYGHHGGVNLKQGKLGQLRKGATHG